MGGCWAAKCRDRSEFGKQMFAFPKKDPCRMKIWVENVNRLDTSNDSPKLLQPTVFSQLCENHFEQRCFTFTKSGKRRLKTDAIPTLFSHKPKWSTDTLPSAPVPGQDGPSPAAAPPTSEVPEIPSTGQKAAGDQRDPSSATLPATSRAFKSLLTGFLYTGQQTTSDCLRLEAAAAHADSPGFPLAAESQVVKLQRKNDELKRRLKQAQKSQRASERRLKQLESSINKVFTQDQLGVLKRRSVRGLKWQAETVMKALRLYSSCGTAGYKELLASGLPFPSVRTLQSRIAEAATTASRPATHMTSSSSRQTSQLTNCVLEGYGLFCGDVGGEEEVTLESGSMFS